MRARIWAGEKGSVRRLGVNDSGSSTVTATSLWTDLKLGRGGSLAMTGFGVGLRIFFLWSDDDSLQHRDGGGNTPSLRHT